MIKGFLFGGSNGPLDKHLIDPSTGWTVEIAACINNSDEICAYLYNSTTEVNAIGILEPNP
jgi:hypothetical protein